MNIKFYVQRYAGYVSKAISKRNGKKQIIKGVLNSDLNTQKASINLYILIIDIKTLNRNLTWVLNPAQIESFFARPTASFPKY